MVWLMYERQATARGKAVALCGKVVALRKAVQMKTMAINGGARGGVRGGARGGAWWLWAR